MGHRAQGAEQKKSQRDDSMLEKVFPEWSSKIADITKKLVILDGDNLEDKWNLSIQIIVIGLFGIN
jgi:hypothetical protein